jgi:glycine/D-amino acid oxidase-like deaminating enzyme
MNQAKTVSGRGTVAVVGGGAFGGWTALELARQGARVVLFDAWGPGNARASSGDASRILRCGNGTESIYTAMAARACQLWLEYQRRWKRPLYYETGVLWLAAQEDAFQRASLAALDDAGLPYEQLSREELEKRYPQVNFEQVSWALYEKQAGYLAARLACQAVAEAFIAEGGAYRKVAALPGRIFGGALGGLRLGDGTRFHADQYVFACGAWLGKIFPQVIGRLVRPTRQEVFFFAVPGGDREFQPGALPIWLEHGNRMFYGIPANRLHAFKIADDTRGREFDPTKGRRTPSAKRLKAAHDYLSFRFPRLRDAPLVDARVCQYEDTPDRHFILDRHPVASNVWILGGGSGHGFKHGPAVGELASQVVLGRKSPPAAFRLSRFAKRA